MSVLLPSYFFFFFFFNDTATTEIYTLSLHDALPIWKCTWRWAGTFIGAIWIMIAPAPNLLDRKSTRLNSSHSQISYAVFCLKKKKKKTNISQTIQLRMINMSTIHLHKPYTDALHICS